MMQIGIPVLNRGDLLNKLVSSIDIEAHVLIIVNRIGPVDTSVDEAVSRLEDHSPSNLRITVARIEGNLGVSGSWNMIMGQFGGNCLISNSDIEFAPGALEEAARQLRTRNGICLQHLWAAACFYVTESFTRTVGWFDENFYPAYHEDQEISLRCAALNVPRAIFKNLGADKIRHTGSQTLKSASETEKRFITEAKKFGTKYLSSRWGALPAPGSSKPAKQHPFDDPSMHSADWTLELDVRAQIANLCKEITGHECPIVYYRAHGGLG